MQIDREVVAHAELVTERRKLVGALQHVTVEDRQFHVQDAVHVGRGRLRGIRTRVHVTESLPIGEFAAENRSIELERLLGATSGVDIGVDVSNVSNQARRSESTKPAHIPGHKPCSAM